MTGNGLTAGPSKGDPLLETYKQLCQREDPSGQDASLVPQTVADEFRQFAASAPSPSSLVSAPDASIATVGESVLPCVSVYSDEAFRHELAALEQEAAKNPGKAD